MVGMEVSMQHVAVGAAGVRSDSFLSRTAIAGCAVWFYFGKFLWPTNLIFVYPRWNVNQRDLLAYVPGMLLVAILAAAWWRRRSWGRPVTMLVVCYVALLLPVLGFVNIYFMEYSLVADHWQYAAIIVPCAAFAGVATELGRRLPWHRPVGYLFCFGLLTVLACLTFGQSRMYADIETLFQVTIERNPNCWMAHNNLGLILAGRGHVDSAIEHYEKGLAIKSDDAAAHYNLAALLARRGQIDAAIAQCEKAVELKPDFTEAQYRLGLALAGRGQVDAAIAHYEKALEVEPNYAEIHYNLGVALANRGQMDAAIDHYQKALRIKPDFVAARRSLSAALAQRKKP